MWNRADSRDAATHGDPQTVGPAAPEHRAHRVPEMCEATLGRSVVVKGELRGSEDLTIDGRLEGRIHLPNHTFTIGPNATIQADIVAKVVIVMGSIVGGITTGDKVEIRQGGSVEGDLVCPRLAIQEGAHFCGTVDMGAPSAHAARG